MPQDYLIAKESLFKSETTKRDYIKENKRQLSVDVSALKNKNYNKFDSSKDPLSTLVASPPTTPRPKYPKSGIVYPFDSITIGDQIWMAHDLDVTSYYDYVEIQNMYTISDGAIDGFVLQYYENTEYDMSIPTHWIWREFDPQSKGYSKWYGPDVINKLAVDPFPGWKVPTVADWEQLISYLGGDTVAGGKLKGPDTANLWNQTGYTYISYSTPFNAVPSGVSSVNEGTSYFIVENEYDFSLGFLRATYMAAYWTSEADRSFYYINHDSNSITRTTAASYTPITSVGFDALMSIRLIRDL